MTSVNSIFTSIAEHTRPNISFTQAYSVVLNHYAGPDCNQKISDLTQKIIDNFDKFISRALSNESVFDIKTYSLIYENFIFFKNTFCNLFKITERFAGPNFFLNRIVDEKFISIFKTYSNFSNLRKTFLESFKNFHFMEFDENDLDFRILHNVSKLIFFVYLHKQNKEVEEETNEIKEFYSALFDFCGIITNDFLSNFYVPNPEEFVESSMNILKIESTLLYYFFPQEMAEKALLRIFREFTKIQIQQTHQIYEAIKLKCKERNIGFIVEYYNFITFREPEEEILLFISDAIHEQIENESWEEIAGLGSIIEYYNKIYNALKNDFLTKKYNRQIAELVNKNPKVIIKSLFYFISRIATNSSNSDISPILPIMNRLENKNEFELIHSRHVTKRLLPLSEKQIAKENSIVTQIKSSSSSYEFTDLIHLLSEASSSIERHIGPVLVAHSSVWPFRQPFPRCNEFDSICEDINIKIKKLYPNRILIFPFDSWLVSTKNTCQNITMVGSAVQAEVLLYFNRHRSIRADSLSPLISKDVLFCVLKSLSSKKNPILIEKKDNEFNDLPEYFINNEYKPKQLFVKLSVPATVNKTASKDVILAKNDGIDAVIMKIMKGNRNMKYNELESKVIEKMCERYRTTSNEIKNRITHLIGRGFIEMSEEDNVLVYVP